jgi:hypothetical protein
MPTSAVVRCAAAALGGGSSELELELLLYTMRRARARSISGRWWGLRAGHQTLGSAVGLTQRRRALRTRRAPPLPHGHGHPRCTILRKTGAVPRMV